MAAINEALAGRPPGGGLASRPEGNGEDSLPDYEGGSEVFRTRDDGTRTSRSPRRQTVVTGEWY